MSYIEYIVMCVVYIQKIMRNFVVCGKKGIHQHRVRKHIIFFRKILFSMSSFE